MKKIFSAVLISFLCLTLTAAGRSKGLPSASESAVNQHKCPRQSARRYNLYIWEGVPGMYYHRVLAQVSIPQNPNGTVVIICPGGSYHHLDILNEGLPTQKWFNKQGATAIILRYRTANRGYHAPAMMEDLQRMVELVRKQPENYGANKESLKVGLIGYSAGGHLVTWGGVNLHPDFVIPVYPVVTMDEDIGHRWSRKSLIGKNPSDKNRLLFSMEKQIPSDMPPTYLVACHDDPVVIYENSERLATALKAAGTDFTFTDYPWGGHGFGMKKCKFLQTFKWNEKLLGWLKERNFF
ncbi:alpha/beta hydrolase [Treponema sp. C6A8]|uniref:alpha/beta hydrolase n=1 Tax=Treponema sp. C6A8 TaxID=1410609 RepID=UPI000688B7DB|nr:alpha/beta hydrolase [Treponema sp. C6A8]